MESKGKLPEHYFKWLTRCFISSITVYVLIYIDLVVSSYQEANPISFAIVLLLIISNIGYLIFLGKLASQHKKSVITWIGSCLIFGPIAQVITYFLMRGIIKRREFEKSLFDKML